MGIWFSEGLIKNTLLFFLGAFNNTHPPAFWWLNHHILSFDKTLSAIRLNIHWIHIFTTYAHTDEAFLD